MGNQALATMGEEEPDRTGVAADVSEFAQPKKWLKHTNLKYGFTVRYPKEWRQATENEADGKWILTLSAGRPDEPGAFATILLEVQNLLDATNGKPVKLKQWRAFNKKMFEADPHAQVLSVKDQKLSTLNGFEMMVELDVGPGVPPAINRLRSCVSVYGSAAYAINCATSEEYWTDFAPLFDEIMDSFTFRSNMFNPAPKGLFGPAEQDLPATVRSVASVYHAPSSDKKLTFGGRTIYEADAPPEKAVFDRVGDRDGRGAQPMPAAPGNAAGKQAGKAKRRPSKPGSSTGQRSNSKGRRPSRDPGTGSGGSKRRGKPSQARQAGSTGSRRVKKDGSAA